MPNEKIDKVGRRCIGTLFEVIGGLTVLSLGLVVWMAIRKQQSGASAVDSTFFGDDDFDLIGG